MCLVRGCALVCSLAIWTYSVTRLPFVIKIISVNGRESMGSCAGECVFVRYASTGFVLCARSNRFEQGTRVHEIVHVSVVFCVVRAHEHFVQCAGTMSSCPCNNLVWDQYGSWAGAFENEVV